MDSKRLAGFGWALAVTQFFVVGLIVQEAWATPYSWVRNNISDLGSAHCAVQVDPERRYVCSPEHVLMNGSFVILSALLVMGALFLAAPLKWARWFFVMAGAGWILVGVAPSDVNENQHVLGALLIMLMGGIGLLLSARSLPGWFGRGTGLLGLMTLTALGLSLARVYCGLGMGGMERASVFPHLVWIFVTGVVMAWGGKNEADRNPFAQVSGS